MFCYSATAHKDCISGENFHCTDSLKNKYLWEFRLIWVYLTSANPDFKKLNACKQIHGLHSKLNYKINIII